MADDVVELTARLVEIDSVNPSLVGGAIGEAEIARFVRDWALAAGLEAELVEPTRGRPSVVVRGGHGDGPTLLLCGHLDTVGLAGMVEPLVARREGDRLWGRGAYDMKAGLAAAMVAVRDAVAAGIAGQVVLAAVADEEHSSSGIQEVLHQVTADAAIVTEPTELAVGIGHRGFVWTEVEVTGVAAHGSRPHLGTDAILKTGPILVELEELDRELRARAHPVVGPGNLHASLITGGSEESTIPDRCLVTIERRTLPGEDAALVAGDVDAVLDRCRAADPELAVTARTTLERPPLLTDPMADVVVALDAAVVAEVGRPAEHEAMSYWADSALIARAGIPSVLFGPSGDGAHGDREWVDVPSTVACARILTAAVVGFCGSRA